MLLELFEQGVNKIIFVSPLRALAEEFSCVVGKGSVFLSKRSESREKLGLFHKRARSILVVIPELVGSDLYDLIKEQQDILVVLDEFHLYYYWGLSFRPQMWEVYMGLINSSSRILALTATLDKKILNDWENDSLQIEQQKVIIDLGNQKLKNAPFKIHYYPSLLNGRYHLRLRLIHETLPNKSGTILLFVRLRHQVDFWVDFFKKRGVDALGCKGGEVTLFVERLDVENPPQIIVATTAISHGVNLPPLSQIFIDYKVANLDFWIQMVGRGGRKGECYEVHTLDSYLGAKFHRGKSMICNYIFGLYLAIRRYFDL